MQKILTFIFILSLLGLEGCSTLEFPGVYKIPIEQGNIITQEMVDQLKPGMTEEQVEFVLGTPLTKDAFNSNRWDYLYSVKRGGQARKQHRLSIFFDKSGNLSYFTGDFQPSPPETNDSDKQTPATESPAASEAEQTTETTASPASTQESPSPAAYWAQYYAGNALPNTQNVDDVFKDQVSVISEGGVKKYLVGPFENKEQAAKARQRLIELGFEDAFIRSPK